MTEQMETKHRNELLTCVLTEEELRGYGVDLALCVQDVAAETDRQADIRAQMKARMAELEARQSQLAIKISRREEYRDVDVEVEYDYDGGCVRTVRTDTGEQLSDRPMREDERQPALPVDE